MWNYRPLAQGLPLVILALMLSAGVLTAQQPFVRFDAMGYESTDTLYWYTGADVRMRVFAGPAGVRLSSSQNVEITSIDSSAGEFLVLLRNPELGRNSLCITATAKGESASQCVVILVEQPELLGGVDQWSGLDAVVGRRYNPSSEWKSTGIPNEHYHTVVWFGRYDAFSRAATSFTDSTLPSGFVINEYSPEIKTEVYWNPGGMIGVDPEDYYDDSWILLLSSHPNRHSVVQLGERRFQIRYATPEHVNGFEFEWLLDSARTSVEFEPIVLRQMIGPDQFIIPLPMAVSCGECPIYGISPRLLPGFKSSRLRFEVIDSSKVARVPNGKRLNVEIAMRGRGEAVGRGTVGITIRTSRSVTSTLDEHTGTSPTASDSGVRRSGDFDHAGIHAIRELLWFHGRAVNIHAVEGDALDGIIASIQAADSFDYYVLDTLGHDLMGSPPPDFAARMIRLARRTGGRADASFRWFTGQLGYVLEVDFEDIDEVTARDIFHLAHTIIEREQLRPARFYLVTSPAPHPKALALLGTKRDDSGNTIVVPTTDAGAMCAIFEGIERKWFERLQRSLVVKSPASGDNAPLRQIWPEPSPRR